jgi:hypothetical protein
MAGRAPPSGRPAYVVIVVRTATAACVISAFYAANASATHSVKAAVAASATPTAAAAAAATRTAATTSSVFAANAVSAASTGIATRTVAGSSTACGSAGAASTSSATFDGNAASSTACGSTGATSAAGTATAAYALPKRACSAACPRFLVQTPERKRQPDTPLDFVQIHLISGRGQRNGDPLLPGAAGAADAMNVTFRVVWNVIVEHVRNPFDVEPARRHIGGDQHLHFRLAKAPHRLLPLRLTQISMQLIHVESARQQLLRQTLGANLRAAEHHRQIRLVRLDQPRKRLFLGPVGRGHDPLLGPFHRHLLALDPHILRIAHIAAGQIADSVRHCGREQRRLATARNRADNLLHLIEKAHRQHLVRLVEH